MKKVLVVLFVLGLISLQFQADARKFQIDVKNEKNYYQATLKYAHPGRKLDGVSSVASDAKPNPMTGSDAPNSNTAESPSNSTDDANSSYGNYRNPSGSSTETHHVYTNDCMPKKNC